MSLIYVLGALVVFPISGYMVVILLWLVGRTGTAYLTTYAWQLLLMCGVYGLLTLPFVLKHLHDRKRTILTLGAVLGSITFLLEFMGNIGGPQPFSFTLTSSLFAALDGILIGLLAGFLVTELWTRLPASKTRS